jgi:flagellar biosynthetic protein FliR
MPGELTIPAPWLYGFLLTLSRISGAFVFVPLPGSHSGPGIARAVLAVSTTLALISHWPAPANVPADIAALAGWLIAEAAIGMMIGLAVAFLVEAFLFGGQILSLQAGYSYASTIDPTTQADSTVIVVIAQMLTGLLFFATALDHQVLLAFARSLETLPPGSFYATPRAADMLISLGSTIFSTGLRLVLPIVILLVMLDLALALMGRLNSHLQLLTITFPIKMLTALGLLAWIVMLFPQVFRQSAAQTMTVLDTLVPR